MTSQKTRTVSLSYARRARTFSVLAAVIALISLLILVLAFSAPFFLLIAPALATVFSFVRAVTWQRAIVTALTRPDEYRCRP